MEGRMENHMEMQSTASFSPKNGEIMLWNILEHARLCKAVFHHTKAVSRLCKAVLARPVLNPLMK